MFELRNDPVAAIDWLLDPTAADERIAWFTHGVLREAQREIERLRSVATAEMKLREGNFAEIERLRARVAELEAHIDFFDPLTKCARCGVEKRQTSLIPEEGEEWECFECWERENARERAAAMKKG